MFSNRLLMVISTRSPSPFCIDGNRAHSTGRPRAPQRRNGPRARPVPERMSRRLMQFVAALLLTAPALPLIASMHEVERIRGLKFDHDIRHVDIGRDELPSRLRAQMAKSMPYSFDDYMLVLRALQLVDGKNDKLMTQLVDLYQSQVLAFYDPLDHVYYSIREMPKTMDAMGLDPEAMRDMVVIHELTHALQDQHFAAGAREKALTKDTDGGLAFHSLLEGEATLVMMDYMLDKMGQPLDALVKNPQVLEAMAGATDKTIDANVPRYFVESLKFPYLEGLKLCMEGYRRGGWKMIDKMDANPRQGQRTGAARASLPPPTPRASSAAAARRRSTTPRSSPRPARSRSSTSASSTGATSSARPRRPAGSTTACRSRRTKTTSRPCWPRRAGTATRARAGSATRTWRSCTSAASRRARRWPAARCASATAPTPR